MPAGKEEQIQKRINRVVGQVTGIQRMIGENRYCVDILHQISAARSALDALGVELLTNHVENCVMGNQTQHPKAKPLKKEEILEELHHVLSRFLK